MPTTIGREANSQKNIFTTGEADVLLQKWNDGEAQWQHREDESDSTHEMEPLLAINETEEESSTRSTNILTIQKRWKSPMVD